ncbi:MAG: hypothetical protein JAY75_14110 [Candidatus Thiodiazotropha taylori]|nr:hypothetical protein [Candidatus Thiodiazotropha taylori]MCG8096537.1 hypothetical protein [Candidatus Thiodiazotropha endolucinida]MCG7883187.1 hypothetical protein [Candidatus Thiodiazotropha taylori]MCG7887559.1 hypothetical protein [Candidatus Thiodiazotropha taylori]MCG7892716.1 hypothetical protein [Candidatus Thiodiazotropha taylori]
MTQAILSGATTTAQNNIYMSYFAFGMETALWEEWLENIQTRDDQKIEPYEQSISVSIHSKKIISETDINHSAPIGELIRQIDSLQIRCAVSNTKTTISTG